MSPNDILEHLTKQGLLPPEQRLKIAEIERLRPFSVHWELRAVLYIGIVLLSTGLGLLVYDNFDRIGHGALLAAMAVACAGCCWFAWQNRPPWSTEQTGSRSTFGDYALLLGCLLFLTLEGYAQYAYNVFGTRYGLVTLLPAALFLPMAYRFDHRGVLGMALTALISWVGVTVRPLELYFKTNFFSQETTFSAIALALAMIGVALVCQQRRIKAHFTDTYLTIAGNLLLVALLGGLFNFEDLRLGFALGLLMACVAFDRFARRQGAFLYLLMSTIYGYIGLSFLFFHYMPFDDLGVVGYWYVVITGVVVVTYLLKQLPRKTKANESV